MNTFSIEELDREEIEFLPARVVMTTCQPKPCWQPAPSKCAPVEHCYTPCKPVEHCYTPCQPVERCEPILKIGITLKLGGGGGLLG